MSQHSVKSTPCKRPVDATHIETDNTYWRNEKGLWQFWLERRGWCDYVGLVNESFLRKFVKL